MGDSANAVDRAVLEASGLYDPASPDAADRLALLEYLVSAGATIDDLLAVDARELPRVASAIVLRKRGHLTRSETAAAAGIPLELAARVWRATGFPDPGSDVADGNEEDVEALVMFRSGVELLGEDAILQLARVMGSSLARIADAMVSTFLVNVGLPSLEEDPSGLALARANTEAMGLLRGASTAIDYLLRRHIEIAQRPLTPGAGDSQTLTVGFVDLVGSTALAQRLAIADLGAVLAEFDALTSEFVVAHGGRVVKLIGDEAMFVVPDPGAACELALVLIEQLDAHPRLPTARVGLAAGDVLTRDGDYFGPIVNLAARMVKVASPGRVVVSSDIRDASSNRDAFASLGNQQLKGFDTPVELFELARRASG